MIFHEFDGFLLSARESRARCGFMIKSGLQPVSEKGRSCSGTMRPTTPFCPWRDANLSPWVPQWYGEIYLDMTDLPFSLVHSRFYTILSYETYIRYEDHEGSE